MVLELQVERVPILDEGGRVPVGAVVIELQARVRAFVEPALPLAEQVPARQGRVVPHGLHERRAVGRDDRALALGGVVEIPLDGDVVPISRVGVGPEADVRHLPGVEIVPVRMEGRVAAGILGVRPEGDAARRNRRRYGSVSVGL